MTEPASPSKGDSPGDENLKLLLGAAQPDSIFAQTLALVGRPESNPQTHPLKNVSLHLASCCEFTWCTPSYPRTQALSELAAPQVAVRRVLAEATPGN